MPWMARIRDGLRGAPRGALAVIAFGLVLTVVCAYLTNVDLASGERLDWEQSADIPASEPVALGQSGELKIVDAGLVSTRPNASKYSVYRVAGALEVSTDDPERRVNAECTVSVPKGVIFARTRSRRAAFPNPSTDLAAQPVPEIANIAFNAKGSDLVGLEINDAFDDYISSGDVVADWGKFKEGEQTFEWTLRGGNRTEPVRLSFAVMWRTVSTPAAARIECEAKTVGGDTARVLTGGVLKKG